jgi:hypothetical protein
MPWSHLVGHWIWKDETGIYRHCKEDEVVVDLQPDFQCGYVWTQEQQIAYIKFMLSGVITGRAIYFNHLHGVHSTILKSSLTYVLTVSSVSALFLFSWMARFQCSAIIIQNMRVESLWIGDILTCTVQ